MAIVESLLVAWHGTAADAVRRLQRSMSQDILKTINTFVIVVLALIVGVTLFLWMLDTFKFRRRIFKAGHAWVIVLLTSSYALLIPGLITELFRVEVSLGGGGSVATLTSLEESMVGFVGELWRSGSWLGAMFIVLYAMVVPTVKIILLILGEVWFNSRKAWQVRCARASVLTLQAISKWASPDMFAYVLLISLVRGMNHPPDLLAEGQLSIGFTCFSVFCIGSTVGTLGVHPPPKPLEDEPTEGDARPPYLARIGAGWLLTATVMTLSAAFTALIVLGFMRPFMSLRLDLQLLLASKGMPQELAPFIEATGLLDLVNVDVSLAECVTRLAQWARAGEANAVVAWILLAIFVMTIPVLHMCVLLVVGFSKGGSCRRQSADNGCRGHFLSSFVNACEDWLSTMELLLMKLSMLDVAVMGVVVVVFAGRVYSESGQGGFLLAGAELCHYMTYLAVSLGEVKEFSLADRVAAAEERVRPHGSARAKARYANRRTSGAQTV